MASRSIKQRLGQWLLMLPALLLPALGLWPDAAFSEHGPHALAATTSAAVAAAADEDPNHARVIVKYRDGSTLARLAASAGRAQHAGRMGVRLALPMLDGRPLGPHSQGLRAQGLSSRQLVARLAAQPDVEWAAVDARRTITGVVPNDPYYGAGQTSITPSVGQWYLRPPDSTTVSAINAEGAWAVSTGSSTVTVAVVDTGVRIDHPDLAGKLWPGYDFVPSSISSDGDGPNADASDPGDWTTSANTCGAANSSWHGTQVAGLIGAASDNAIGMASVGRNVRVLPVRVLGQCGGFDSDIQAGMLWAAGLTTSPTRNPHPAQVINLSLGSATACGSYQPVIDQLVAAGVTVVVAAGNGTGLAVDAPANCSGVIAVAGLRHAGTKVGYSNLGPQVALAAPAGNSVNETGPCLYPLLTTLNAGLTTPGANTYSDSRKSSLGTSFSAPLVAGTVGLMLSVDPTLTPAKIKAVLQATARVFPSVGAQTDGATACVAPSAATQVECYCTTSTCGAGILDTGAAVARAAGVTSPPVAVFAASKPAAHAAETVTLQGSPSSRSAVVYQWAISADAAQSSFTAGSSLADTTLVMAHPGSVTVSLTVTDSAGSSATTRSTLVSAPSVSINPVSTVPLAGSDVAVSGSATAYGGRSVSSYQWSISAGSSLASFVGATDQPSATLATSSAGLVTVQLIATDSGGGRAVTTTTLTVAAAPVVVVVTPPAVSSGGGGAMGWGWMAGLACAVLLLARRRST